MEIAFIATGGSIDKDYPRATKGYAFEITEPAVERVLNKMSLNFKYSIKQVLKKDSLEITEADRKKILTACKKTKSEKIIVTHGTDTMLKTAKLLSQIKEKTIILTGATKPERFKGSDAEFNLGLAIGAVSTLDSGVFIAMNGCVYKWDKCNRDNKTGKFIGK